MSLSCPPREAGQGSSDHNRALRVQGTRERLTQTSQSTGDKGKQPLTWGWDGDRAECPAFLPGAGAKKRHFKQLAQQEGTGVGNRKFYLNRLTSPESFEPSHLT